MRRGRQEVGPRKAALAGAGRPTESRAVRLQRRRRRGRRRHSHRAAVAWGRIGTDAGRAPRRVAAAPKTCFAWALGPARRAAHNSFQRRGPRAPVGGPEAAPGEAALARARGVRLVRPGPTHVFGCRGRSRLSRRGPGGHRRRRGSGRGRQRRRAEGAVGSSSERHQVRGLGLFFGDGLAHEVCADIDLVVRPDEPGPGHRCAGAPGARRPRGPRPTGAR